MQRKVPESVGACFDLIERTMLRGPWVMGDSYTICDPHLFALAQWQEQDGVDPSRIPNVMAHRERMSERPEVRKAIAEELACSWPEADRSALRRQNRSCAQHLE